jgi:hypothetical protein
LHEAQYAFIAKNRDRYNEYARRAYAKRKLDPDRMAASKAARQAWWDANKTTQLEKQRLKKRERKIEAVAYLGGKCRSCSGEFHPAIYEFHHRNPEQKDRDPSKMLLMSWDKLTVELDKCDLLCANCHRLAHHRWENNNV